MSGSSSSSAPRPTTTSSNALQNLNSAISRSTRSGGSAVGAATVDVIEASPGAERGERAVVERAQQRLGGDRPEQSREHVPLRVPHVALSAEERISGGAAGHGDPPFHELAAGRKR